jgi:hypothetical protein
MKGTGGVRRLLVLLIITAPNVVANMRADSLALQTSLQSAASVRLHTAASTQRLQEALTPEQQQEQYAEQQQQYEQQQQQYDQQQAQQQAEQQAEQQQPAPEQQQPAPEQQQQPQYYPEPGEVQYQVCALYNVDRRIE